MLEIIQGLWLSLCGDGIYLAMIQIQPILYIRFWEAQVMDLEIMGHINQFIPDGYNNGNFKITDDGLC